VADAVLLLQGRAPHLASHITSGGFFYCGYFAKPTTMAARKNRPNLIVLPSVAPGNLGALAYLAF
jgi:hypothetical protein